MALKRTKNARGTKILSGQTQISLPFETVQAESNSDQPTPFHKHPHPPEGVSFQNHPDWAQTVPGPSLNTTQLFFSRSDHPRQNQPPQSATPKRIRDIFSLKKRKNCVKMSADICLAVQNTSPSPKPPLEKFHPWYGGEHPSPPWAAPGTARVLLTRSLDGKMMSEAPLQFSS